ncbi:MAG: tol-pal system protein YbgF [Thiomicrorhabdus chilensis]|uniref:tol-pal system protein YbgF n=1 Tax=Thiomicrorhabdus chilensis TaxID=63656 RepID=UPI00299EC4A1|nr:tol-pal system protein YbgF [Thiomicrorhabdus chilensis]MDX1347536.1 tol-pal system protein YbgF [Thiomicrorhabdus chilensis]
MKKRIQLAVISSLVLSFSSAHAAPAGSIEDRILRLERMADNPVLLQLSQRLGEQQREIQRLHDEIDRLKRAQSNFLERAKGREEETDQRISALETKLKSYESGVPSATVPALTPSLPAQSVTTPASGHATDPEVSQVIATYPATADENAQYQKAFALMRAAQYRESIAAFEAFIKQSPGSSLASNASYWAGEGYLILKDYDKALNAFERIMQQYPGSSKEPDAMLRAADSLIQLKENEKAVQLYKKLIASYPDSRAAESAAKRLNP